MEELLAERNIREPIIEIAEWSDDFQCHKCKNHSHNCGFFPCSPSGEYIEPDYSWRNYWRCDKCGQRYLQL